MACPCLHEQMSAWRAACVALEAGTGSATPARTLPTASCERPYACCTHTQRAAPAARLHLKALLGGALGAGHHTSVEDEQVKAGQGGRQVGAQRLDAHQVGEVELLDCELALLQCMGMVGGWVGGWVGGRCNTNLKEWFVSSGSSGPAAAKVCSPPPHLEALQLRCRPLARFDAAGAQDHVCTGVRQRPARL